MVFDPLAPESLDDAPLQALVVETSRAIDEPELSRRVAAIFAALERSTAEVCVLIVDDAEIADLNSQWRQVEGPTDVLSFPMSEGEEMDVFAGDMLGDIAVSAETAERIVAEAEHRDRVAAALGVAADTLVWDLLDELTFLMVHGALHLVGHDHDEPEREAEMRAAEARLFAPFLRTR